MKYDIVVVGAGASGLFFRKHFSELIKLSSPKKKLHCLFVDANEVLGKKLLVTGNGRCNLLPSQLESHAFYSSSKEILEEHLKSPYLEILKLVFQNWGLYLWKEENRFYPRSLQAQTVQTCLTQVHLEENAPIKWTVFSSTLCTKFYFQKEEKHYKVYLKNLENEEVFSVQAEHLILATGGLAGQNTQLSSLEHLLLKADLGLENKAFIPLSPALCPLEMKSPLRHLQGQRVKARIHLIYTVKDFNDKKCRKIFTKKGQTCSVEESGELLFTDYGLSGVMIMNISRFFARKTERPEEIIDLALDFLEEFTEEDLEHLLRIGTGIQGLLPAKLLYHFMRLLDEEDLLPKKYSRKNQENTLEIVKKQNSKKKVKDEKKAKISPSPYDLQFFSHIGHEDKLIQKVISLCKHYSLQPSSIHSRDFSYAQISRGGLCLNMLNKDFSLRAHENLFVVGEALDVDAICGGNNLYWAFHSAQLAAEKLFRKYSHATTQPN